jgi:hypothetical protein
MRLPQVSTAMRNTSEYSAVVSEKNSPAPPAENIAAAGYFSSHCSRRTDACGSNASCASKSVSGNDSNPRGSAAFRSFGCMRPSCPLLSFAHGSREFAAYGIE